MLVVVDGSLCTQRAVIVTGALARDCGAEVIVGLARTVAPSGRGVVESQPKERAQQLVDEAGDALERLGAHVVERLVVASMSSPSASIIQTALDRAVSIIVVANPGQSRLRSRLSSSWVKRLLATSDIPVLLVGADRVKSGRLLQLQRLGRPEPTLGHA